MAVQFGLFYFDPDNSSPAVVIKTMQPGWVLIRIWAEGGDQNRVAPLADSPGLGVFVLDG